MDGGQLLPNWVLFGQLLRRLGIAVTARQIEAVIEALGHLDLGRRDDVKVAARAILVHRRSQQALFDRAFDRFWRAENAGLQPPVALGRAAGRAPRRRQPQAGVAATAGDEPPPGTDDGSPRIERRFTYSAREVLRQKDFAELTAEERAAVKVLLQEEVLALPPRRTRRRVASPAGPHLDLRRTLRRSLRFGGEPMKLAWRQRRERRRPLVVLCDVSGSMEPYARIFLQFIYALASWSDRLEAFVFGTRLTRITHALRHRDVDQALSRAAAAVRDWGGGTRIGEALRRFNYDWGRRVLGQGAVAMVISDGWDRGDLELLEREVARLERSCERLIWLNPLLGSPGYEPLTRGIRAILPHVDDFLPLYNLDSLTRLGQHLADLPPRSRRPPAAEAPSPPA